ncbi:MAG: gfo/Idh/MocA family oxidoreductase [Cyanobacteria bacterium RI_101]|nr:gfo/Idh/MocA family oxidoreductase [Cyanobacteria bacterium RI_101]
MEGDAVIQVGLIGTGFAAARRAEALREDSRGRLFAVAGHRPDSTLAFAEKFGLTAQEDWRELIQSPAVELVMVCGVNRDHGEMVRAALEADKHVVVEYPLCLDYAEGEALFALARRRRKLLHVEHIELLGGLHQAIRRYLPEIGAVAYARYATVQPQTPAPERWTYHAEEFGFPLIAALSRVHRLTDLFGAVAGVSCQNRIWARDNSPYYRGCLCQSQLGFQNGVMAEVLYGKGEVFAWGERRFLIEGEAGTLIFDGEEGVLRRGDEEKTLEVGSKRGLFLKDTQAVLDHLIDGAPLYVRPEASLYALKVAAGAQTSVLEARQVRLR